MPPDLSVKIDYLFADEAHADHVHRVADVGVEAIGFRPWYGDALPEVVAAARERDLSIAYLSGGDEATDGPEFPLTDPDRLDEGIAGIERMIERAAEAGAATVNVIPGLECDRIGRAAHHVATVEALREVAPVAEDTGVTIVLEPLNTRVDHPGYYLTDADEGYEIVRAVDSPRVKLLFDVYHEQIAAGDVIGRFREYADAVGDVHVADVPGRHEPGTGELNYGPILDAIDETGYDGYVECEFRPRGDPVEAIRGVQSLL